MAQIYVDLSSSVTINKVSKNDQSIKIGDNQNSDLAAPLAGSWEEFTDLTDERVIASQKHLLTNYPGLSSYKLDKVESQIVSGINFRFFYVHTETNESFIAQVYYPFSGQPQITSTWGVVYDGMNMIV